MPTPTTAKQAQAHRRRWSIRLLAAVFLVLVPLPVLALDYSAQVDSVQDEIATYQDAQVRLGDYAVNLQQALADSDNQLRAVQAQIAVNEARYNSLTSELIFRQADVNAKSRQVGGVLRANYIDADITAFELLASTDSLSDYIDRYEYRDRLQVQLQRDLARLVSAQELVVSQRQEVAAILRDGKAMRDTLQQKQREQQELLDRTLGQQAIYQQLINERSASLNELRGRQLAANQAAFSGGQLIAGDPAKGGYPAKWADAAQDSLIDDWGMYNRECVSYTAWRVAQAGKRMPYWGGRGNANQWPSSAQSDGIATGSEAQPGAVAIAFIGPYGHAMYVEEVLDEGKIRISEFNYLVDGTYTERIVNGRGLTYIYF